MYTTYSTDPILEFYKEKSRKLQTQVNDLQAQIQDNTYVPKHTESKGLRLRHTPYVYEVTSVNKTDIEANSDMFFYIQDDKSRGLGTPGRNGYIKNDGPGVIQYLIQDDKGNTSFPATLKPGESDSYKYSDNIHVVVLIVRANTAETMYRMRWTSGLEGVINDRK